MSEPQAAIKPCPFCGHPGRYSEYRYDYGWERKVYCDGCDAIGPDRGSEVAAITAWNQRALPRGLVFIEQDGSIREPTARDT
jgi:Lar family restriction alleviation protein